MKCAPKEECPCIEDGTKNQIEGRDIENGALVEDQLLVSDYHTRKNITSNRDDVALKVVDALLYW